MFNCFSGHITNYRFDHPPVNDARLHSAPTYVHRKAGKLWSITTPLSYHTSADYMNGSIGARTTGENYQVAIAQHPLDLVPTEPVGDLGTLHIPYHTWAWGEPGFSFSPMTPPSNSTGGVILEGHSLSVVYLSDGQDIGHKYEIRMNQNGRAIIDVWVREKVLESEQSLKLQWTRADDTSVRSFCMVRIRRGPTAKASYTIMGYMIRERLSGRESSGWYRVAGHGNGHGLRAPSWSTLQVDNIDPNYILGILTVAFYNIRNDVRPGIFEDHDRREFIEPTFFHRYLETPDDAQLTVKFWFRFRPVRPLSTRKIYMDMPVSRKKRKPRKNKKADNASHPSDKVIDLTLDDNLGGTSRSLPGPTPSRTGNMTRTSVSNDPVPGTSVGQRDHDDLGSLLDKIADFKRKGQSLLGEVNSKKEEIIEKLNMIQTMENMMFE
ncbi:hypothetical protein QCA50_008013 [Cerrena zonata]|uniref:Uncharacterized protein n=1 Tax=Cerrena zonata TaxID=2478898 RepID=A0AAW0GBF7_9APHY